MGTRTSPAGGTRGQECRGARPRRLCRVFCTAQDLRVADDLAEADATDGSKGRALKELVPAWQRRAMRCVLAVLATVDSDSSAGVVEVCLSVKKTEIQYKPHVKASSSTL